MDEIVGILRKERTVGYRSPYRVGDLEIWGEDLEPWIGKSVRLMGRHVTIPAQKAPPGSEAASRFLDGVIPEIRRFEVLRVLPG